MLERPAAAGEPPPEYLVDDVSATVANILLRSDTEAKPAGRAVAHPRRASRQLDPGKSWRGASGIPVVAAPSTATAPARSSASSSSTSSRSPGVLSRLGDSLGGCSPGDPAAQHRRPLHRQRLRHVPADRRAGRRLRPGRARSRSGAPRGCCPPTGVGLAGRAAAPRRRSSSSPGCRASGDRRALRGAADAGAAVRSTTSRSASAWSRRSGRCRWRSASTSCCRSSPSAYFRQPIVGLARRRGDRRSLGTRWPHHADGVASCSAST